MLNADLLLSMPVITTVPRMRRPAAPEPDAVHSGTQPSTNANDVIRIFGYERGAFTGALQTPKPGRIEMAAGGVLFLDEVGEMSGSAQAKMLRVLQERELQRLGGTRTIKANVRVIAATNREPRRAMERGDFREDLYYRLQVFEIRLPPLRATPRLEAAPLPTVLRADRRPAAECREALERGAPTLRSLRRARDPRTSGVHLSPTPKQIEAQSAPAQFEDVVG